MMTPVMPAVAPTSGPAARPTGRGADERFAAALAAEEDATFAPPGSAADATAGQPGDAVPAPGTPVAGEEGEDGAAHPGQAGAASGAGTELSTEGVGQAARASGGPETPVQQASAQQTQTQAPQSRLQQAQAQAHQGQAQQAQATQTQHAHAQSAQGQIPGQGTPQVAGQQVPGQLQGGDAVPVPHAQQAQGQAHLQQPVAPDASALQGQGATQPAHGHSQSAPVPPAQPHPTAPAVHVPAAGGEPVQGVVGPQVPVDAQQATAQPVATQPASAGGAEAGAPAATTPSTSPSTAPTAPAAPAAAAPALPQPPPLGNQLAASLARLQTAPDGHHVLNIRVDPEDLGPVRVSAHIGTDGVRIELFGMTEAARDALRGALADLRRELAATGLQADLDLGSEETGAEESGTPGQHIERQQTVAVADQTPTTDPTVPLGGRGLDILA